jgi:hypothetical protein
MAALRSLLRLLLFSMLGAAALAAPALDETRRDPQVGTRVLADAGGWIEVVDVTPTYVKTINAAGAVTLRYGNLFSQGGRIDSEFDREVASRLWPLEVGKSVAFPLSRGTQRWEETLTVLRTETLSIAGEEVPTFVIESRERATTQDYDRRLLYWYAPKYAVMVKHDWEQLRGTPPGYKPWTATKIALPAPPRLALTAGTEIDCESSYLRVTAPGVFLCGERPPNAGLGGGLFKTFDVIGRTADGRAVNAMLHQAWSATRSETILSWLGAFQVSKMPRLSR